VDCLTPQSHQQTCRTYRSTLPSKAQSKQVSARSRRCRRRDSKDLHFHNASWLNVGLDWHWSEGQETRWSATVCGRCAKKKKLSQGDIEKRTGLLRCYISRVENGHTVPTVETLEKMARALEVPLYRLFYDGDALPKLENLPKRKTADEIAWGSSGREARFLSNLRRLLARAEERDRRLLLSLAQKLATKRNRRKSIAA
jgi:transcriptional regulator with XRE-family HTH domain